VSGLSIARLLMFLGAAIFLVGGGIYLFSRLGINLFRLPGDIRFQIGNVTCAVPLVTMLVLSLVLTVLLNVIVRLMDR
jgi:Protein of unknown function (DUF2905)